MTDTLRSMRAIIQKEGRGDFAGTPDEDIIVNDAINDAIESIWMSMMQVQLAKFIGADSPVTFSLPQNSERITVVSIADPTVAPTVQQTAGGNLVDGASFVFGYTFVTESGSETNISPLTNGPARINNNLFQVLAPVNPGTAFGWNCYAGASAGQLALQNQQPLPFGLAYFEPVTEFQSYPTIQQRPPLSNTTADNLSWIQHLEIRTSDTLLRAWNQVDIDSEIMRRMARTLSSASEYQAYVWELTGNGVLEFRPMLGSSFSPRYWYIAKPRRLRYDQAEIPYASVVGVHKFIKAQAKADLYLGVNEFLNQEGWQNVADKERLNIQMALTQELWAKNTRVVPMLW